MGTLQVDTAWVLYVRGSPTRKSPAGTGAPSNYMRLTDWHRTASMTYKLDVYCGANNGPMCQFHVACSTNSSGDYTVSSPTAPAQNRYWYSLRADAPQEFFLIKNNADNLYALYCYGPDNQWISVMGFTGMTSVDRPTIVAVQSDPLPASYTAYWSTMALPGATPPFAGLVSSADAHLGSLVIESTTNSIGIGSGALVVNGGASFDGDVHVSGSVNATGGMAGSAVSPFEVMSQTLPAEKLQVVVSDGITPASTLAGEVYLNAAGTSFQIRLSRPMWNDAMALTTLRTTGVGNFPTLQAFLTINAGGDIGNVAMQQLQWASSANDWIPFTLQLDHQWAPNTRISPHVHVVPYDRTTTANTYFDLAWEVKDIYGGVPAEDDPLKTLYETGAPSASHNIFSGTATLPTGAVQMRHVMINFSSGTPQLGTYSRSAVIVGALRRRAGGDTAKITLVGFDFHVQNNRLMGDMGPYGPE